ncbi:discoidin domain-containing protein [Ideonella sp. DXS29W]|uniref:Discoidin domain-containing protein n=1 Tax=Ideonella lacteola TaxID=2984193 RepID=A0ABU9BR73_9BURK
MKALFCVALAWLAASAMAAPGDTRLIDGFQSGEGWVTSASDQVSARWRADARGGHCLDYDFHHVSGYAVARRHLPPLDLPANYEFRLRWRGEGPPNHFQFKLTDASGENVWWAQQRDVKPPHETREWRIKQRQIEFAWGPTTQTTLTSPAALELVMASGTGGGRGSVCFERLDLVERAPPPATWPAPQWRQSTSAAGAAPWVEVDWGLTREFSGLVLQWPPGTPRPRDYQIRAQGDDGRWRTLKQVRRAAGPVDALVLPDEEARRLRLQAPAGSPAFPLPTLEPVAAGRWRQADDATTARAAQLPRGLFPRTYLGEQNYWTLFGVDGGGGHAALLSEDGAIEPLPGSPSIEPFVLLETGPSGRLQLVSWADVRLEHALPDGYLPQPRVRWIHPAFTLDIEAGASGDTRHAVGLARYTLRGRGSAPLKARLLLAARPWQVNPPQQFLNLAGGTSPLSEVAWQQGTWRWNGRLGLRPSPAPSQVLAGGGADWPLAQALAQSAAVSTLSARGAGAAWRDPDGQAESVLVYPVASPAGGRTGPGAGPGSSETSDGPLLSVALSWPLTGQPRLPGSVAAVDRALADSAASWRARLNRVGFELPAAAQPVHDTLRSALAQILLSRRGPALQPGTRSYARSWVRDGAMMVAGLLRLGETEAATEFVDWYATQLFDNGKVPCCVDARGADPVPENDSHGQFIYAVAELWRFTHDRARLERHWPAVQRAVRYMEQLRQSERLATPRPPGTEAFHGLMPASISHEGYSAKPMHSYWDDFWALRGYKDAVLLAQALRDDTQARTFATWRDEFSADLSASVRAATAWHRINHMPGAAELGDFDPTSTTVALNPAQAQSLLPAGLLEATFERYVRESLQRRDGQRDWRDYTPYELRGVGALVRLHRPEDARALLNFFFADQRPAGWNQWAEVVMRDAREKHFLGDMPHAWVASDAIRSLLDLFVHDEDDGQTLVLAAGLSDDWLRDGVAVRDLPTPFGRISYRARRESGGLRVEIGDSLALPPGGLKIRWRHADQRVEALPARLWIPDRP